jgi:hypothetical protein
MSRDDEAISALRAVMEGTPPHDLESPTLDFKEEKKTADETIKLLLQASICFANANGGVIVVGVANKAGGGEAVVGCEIEADLLQRRIFELSRPPLTVDVRRETRFGRPLLFVYVPRSPDIHADPQGRAPRRVGTACLPMGPAEQSRLRDERTGFNWSAQPSSRAPSDVSQTAMETARRRLGFGAKHRGLRRLSPLAPVVWIEWLVVRRRPSLALAPVGKGIAWANVASSIIGVPIAWGSLGSSPATPSRIAGSSTRTTFRRIMSFQSFSALRGSRPSRPSG